MPTRAKTQAPTPTPAPTPPTTAKTVVKAAPKATKAPAKTPAKAVVKPATKPRTKPAAKTAVKPVAKPPALARPAPVPKKDKEKKPKLVRDSFTIPKSEFAAIEALKARAIAQGLSVKKSELLRAGLKALVAMGDSAFKSALAAVPTLKTGRPGATDSAAKR